MEKDSMKDSMEDHQHAEPKFVPRDSVGLYVIKICVPGNGDFRVARSVEHIWNASDTVAESSDTIKGHSVHVTDTDQSTFENFHQDTAKQLVSRSGFSIKRFLPRSTSQGQSDAHFQEGYLTESANSRSSQNRDQPIPPLASEFGPSKSSPLTNGHVNGSMAEGATNPAFSADDDNQVLVTHFGADTETKIVPKTSRDVDVMATEPQKVEDIKLTLTLNTDHLKKDVDTVIPPQTTPNMTANTSKNNGDVNIVDLDGDEFPDIPTGKSIRRNKVTEALNKAVKPPTTPGDDDAKWLEWIGSKFKEISGEDGQIDLQEFKKALGVRKSFFAERFFALFDQDDSGSIELGELMDGLRMLMKGSPAQKLQFLFDVYDADGSGTIDRDELENVLKACMEESSLSLSDDAVQELTDVLFDAADEDDSGTITFDELRTELEKHPGVIENLTISAANWLKPPEPEKDGKKARFRYFTADYLRNNVRKVWFFFFYVALNIALFALAVWQYRTANIWIQIARGCGLCLNFNCMWVLVLMLRKCITFLRMTKLCVILPFDQHILFHKMAGLAIAVFSLVHSLAHLANGVSITSGGEHDIGMKLWEVLFTTKAGIGWVEASAFITGWLLDIILIIMVICSMPFVRRSGHFQVFYWTHMLYIPFWILVLLHGPHFWKWFVLPGVLFIMEKISRSKLIKMARFGDTFIEEVNLLPSGVTHLMISRPVNFKYQPGDYLFIQIPAIAKQEWHPFTISSAPEMEGRLWLHVRSAGHWTNKLYEYFDELKVEEEENVGSVRGRFNKFERALSRKHTRAKKVKTKNKVVKVKCFLDGPYGTGTREVFDTQHAVLIGAGIGVTPMASILQSVWYRFTAVRQKCPSCRHEFYADDGMDMTLKKLDFIWINRDQRSFEWFLTLLSQIELEQAEHGGALDNCIEFHMYMTAAQKKTDMKGIGLQIALDLMHEKTQKDMITGLKTRTKPGRPDWNKVFKEIQAQNKGKIKVFFCGAPALGRTVKETCQRFNFAFSKENF